MFLFITLKIYYVSLIVYIIDLPGVGCKEILVDIRPYSKDANFSIASLEVL